jgi:CII-binding regulator of phage lambda lysogenization HflD
MAEYELRSRESPIEQRYRQSLLDAEKAFEAQRTAEARVRDRSDSLAAQLDVLHQQQQTLMRQMEQIAEQQKALADMQRRMATETERLREALKAR